MKIYIYALCDPQTGIPKYIGRSKQPNKRLTQHIQEIKRYDNDKTRWLKSLMNNYQLPELIILEETNVKDCVYWEEFYVELFNSWGIRVFNTENGFGTNYCHEETAKKISENSNNKGRKVIHSEETRQKISESLKKRLIIQPQDKVIKREGLIKAVGTPIECTNESGEILIFDSISRAAESLNLKHKKIQDKLKGRRRGKYKGWSFRYKEGV